MDPQLWYIHNITALLHRFIWSSDCARKSLSIGRWGFSFFKCPPPCWHATSPALWPPLRLSLQGQQEAGQIFPRMHCHLWSFPVSDGTFSESGASFQSSARHFARVRCCSANPWRCAPSHLLSGGSHRLGNLLLHTVTFTATSHCDWSALQRWARSTGVSFSLLQT